jgi:hypothetical protein
MELPLLNNEDHEDIQNYVGTLFSSLALCKYGFRIFYTPFQKNFNNSLLPIDLILGLYSLCINDIHVQLYIADVFMGEYTLPPRSPVPLKRFVLRFLFYGYKQEDLIRVQYVNTNKETNQDIMFICCLLDNDVRKNIVLQAFR